MLDESFLERIQLSVHHQTFHGGNLPAIHPDGKLAAGENILAVQQNGASAALSRIASNLRPREPEMVAQGPACVVGPEQAALLQDRNDGVGEAGGVPERSKGADCKSVGYAFAGSNPAPSKLMYLLFCKIVRV